MAKCAESKRVNKINSYYTKEHLQDEESVIDVILITKYTQAVFLFKTKFWQLVFTAFQVDNGIS